MKYILFLLMFVGSASLAAQDGMSETERAIQKTVLMYKLDDGQAATLRTLVETKNTALKKLENGTTNRDEMSLKKKAIVEDYNRNFRAMLNEDQKKMYEMYSALTPDLKKASEGPMIRKGEPVKSPQANQ